MEAERKSFFFFFLSFVSQNFRLLSQMVELVSQNVASIGGKTFQWLKSFRRFLECDLAGKFLVLWTLQRECH